MHTQLQLYKHVALIFYLDKLTGDHHHRCIVMYVLLSTRVVEPDKVEKEFAVNGEFSFNIFFTLCTAHGTYSWIALYHSLLQHDKLKTTDIEHIANSPKYSIPHHLRWDMGMSFL